MEGKRARAWWRRAPRAAALLLAGFALWLSIRQVRLPSLIAVVTGAQAGWIVLSLLAVVTTTGLKAIRWYVLLRRCRPRAPLARFARLLLIGQLANTLLPRLGDVVRGVWLGSAVTGGVPAVFGSLVVEKAMDALLGLAVLFGLAAYAPLPAWLERSVTGLSIAGAATLVALFAVRASRVRLTALAQQLPGGIGARIGHVASDFLLGLDMLRAPADAGLVLLLSATVWAVAVATNMLTMRALGIEAPSWSAWLVVVTVYGATFLPTVPTQVGVFEYAAVLALQAAGVDAEQALAFAFLLHLLVLAPPAILGTLSMAIEGIEWQGLKAARETVGERRQR